MFTKLIGILFLLFFAVNINAQLKTKLFQELESIDSIKSQINFDSTNTWNFILADQSGDSLTLSRKLKNFKSQQFEISIITKFDDSTPLYQGKYLATFSEEKKISLQELEREYNYVSKLAHSLELSLLGFEVEIYEKSYFQIPPSLNKNQNSERKIVTIHVFNDENKPLPYAEVRISNQDFRILTNKFGVTVFEMEVSTANSEITVSNYGFQTENITITKESEYIVKLKKDNISYYNIDEIILRAKKVKYLESGVTRPRKNVMGFVNFKSNEGAEVGKIFKNDKTLKIKSFSVYVGANSSDHFEMKGRIYSTKNNAPQQVIYEKLISSEIKSGWLNVVLDKPIVLNNDFLIAFQWVGDQRNNPIFSLGAGKDPLNIIRNRSRTSWITTELNWAIKIKTFKQ